MVTDKRQGQWYASVVNARRFGEGRPLGGREYMACHAEDPRASTVRGSHRKVLDGNDRPATDFVRLRKRY